MNNQIILSQDFAVHKKGKILEVSKKGRLIASNLVNRQKVARYKSEKKKTSK